MNRKIAALMIALPLGAVSLLPKSASAAEINSQVSSIHRSPVVVAQQSQQDRYRQTQSQQDQYRQTQSQQDRYRQTHRHWVPGHWEKDRHGHRRWVPGHWVYSR